MLWVTITIVYSAVSSSISSSILAVEIGSSAEQGSSSRITSGLTATVRAMQRRCCWPPERLSPFLQLVLHLVPERGAAQRRFDAVVELGARQFHRA